MNMADIIDDDDQTNKTIILTIPQKTEHEKVTLTIFLCNFEMSHASMKNALRIMSHCRAYNQVGKISFHKNM